MILVGVDLSHRTRGRTRELLSYSLCDEEHLPMALHDGKKNQRLGARI